jgi:hypothetical protein
MKYFIGVSGKAFMVADESQHSLLEQVFGHTVEALLNVRVISFRFLFQPSDEAHRV